MNRIVAIILVGMLCGCGDSRKISLVQAAVVERLRDPDSARFDNVRISNGAVCGEVNARNGFGGYGEPMPFVGTVEPDGSVQLEMSEDPGFFGRYYPLCENMPSVPENEILPVDVISPDLNVSLPADVNALPMDVNVSTSPANGL